MDEKTIARFWAKVQRGGADQCWEWQGYRYPKGYGYIRARGAAIYAHRMAAAIAGYPIELRPGNKSSQCVCHRCDNPPCCNPAHLFVGTTLDNMRDKMAKGRQARVVAGFGFQARRPARVAPRW